MLEVFADVMRGHGWIQRRLWRAWMLCLGGAVRIADAFQPRGTSLKKIHGPVVCEADGIRRFRCFHVFLHIVKGLFGAYREATLLYRGGSSVRLY